MTMFTSRSLLRDTALICAACLCLFLLRCTEGQRQNELRSDGRADDAVAHDPLDDGTADIIETGATRDRKAAVNDLQDMRAEMMAELEVVRTRLNDGARPREERKVDEGRAAVLAQGLERVDRTLRLAEQADDNPWAAAADTTRRATQEVRAWWSRHRDGA